MLRCSVLDTFKHHLSVYAMPYLAIHTVELQRLHLRVPYSCIYADIRAAHVKYSC